MNQEANEKLQEELKNKYNYCKHIKWVAFPSVTPQFYQGEMPTCDKDDHLINNIAQCYNCECFNGCKEDCEDCNCCSGC